MEEFLTGHGEHCPAFMETYNYGMEGGAPHQVKYFVTKVSTQCEYFFFALRNVSTYFWVLASHFLIVHT